MTFFLFFRKNADIDNFARKLADDLFSEFPSEEAYGGIFFGSASSQKHQNLKWKAVESALNNTRDQMRQFQIDYRLGIYGKARLYLSFTERLKNLGYDRRLAEEINKALMLQIK